MLDFDVAPYYDDSEENAIPSNYLRILFKPDFAVQARELTALQSILQNQISSLGSFVFADGSPVSGGHISLDLTCTALALQQQFANVDISLNSFLVDNEPTLITDTTGQNVKAVVMAVDPTQANPTILVKYLTATEFQPGQTIQVAVGVQTQAQLVTSNASNPGCIASIATGTFYSGGLFIDVLPQTIVVSSNTNAPNARIGLEVNEDIVSYQQDSTLLDPALGTTNYQAPGADRYQYTLTLASRSFASIDDSAFYDLLEVQNGLITKQIDYPVFADLDKALAQRTYDTNGNFTVRPFGITTSVNPANNQQFAIVVSPGKAYVKGFEFHTLGIQDIYVTKAIQTNTVTNFGFSTEFGNFVTVQDLYSGNANGFFDVGNFANVDLHVCNVASLNTTNSSTYNATKMGVARIRDIEFLGLGLYFAYITDIQILGNTFIAAAGSSQSITLPAIFGQLGGNCFANVTVTVNTSGIIDTRTITTYANTTRIASLSAPLSIPATGSSNCTLNFNIVNLDSLVQAPIQFGGNNWFYQNTTTPYCASMDVSVGGKNISGNTILQDQQLNKLIFPLPQNYIAQNTINSAQFFHRKNLYSQTFTSGNLTISTGSGLGSGESFPYGFTNSYLSDAAANNNFLVVVRNAQSSNLSNGEIINWNVNSTPGGNGVFQTDNTHVTIAVGTNATFIGDILFTVQVTNANAASVARRTKTFVGNANNTVLQSTDSYLNGNAVIGTTNANSVWVDSQNGYVWFTSNAPISNTPGTRVGLGIPDVVGITKVYCSGSASFQPNVSNAIDVTGSFMLDSGQTDNYYDHGGLILVPGATPPSGQVVALLTWYQHDSVNGFFDADSYPATIYNSESIPFYNSTKYGTFTLRDCIDFRPTRVEGYTANIQIFVLKGLDLPQPDDSFQLGYQYYLPRIDKLQVTKDKNFRVLTGVPSVYPQAPADTDDAMTIYTLSIPAFTANVAAIGLQYIENKRYTMKDIAALDTRIQQLEYYSALSQLEAQTVNEKILYQDGVTAKDTYGIIADDFGDFTIADVSNPDTVCYLEPGSLGPLKAQWSLQFQFAANTGGAVITPANKTRCWCLDYTETPALSQNAASTFISVQPFLFAQFKGLLALYPSTDSYFSSNLVPQTTTPIVAPKPAPEPAAPTMSGFSVAAPVPVVVGHGPVGNEEEEDFWYNGHGAAYTYGFFQGGVYTGYYYNKFATGFGVTNTIYNWYGTPVSNTLVAVANTAPIALGSSISLPPGGNLTSPAAPLKSGTSLNLIG